MSEEDEANEAELDKTLISRKIQKGCFLCWWSVVNRTGDEAKGRRSRNKMSGGSASCH